MAQITDVFPIFHDLEGNALENGSIYIGEPNLDAETNPKAVFFDAANTNGATQPVRTLNGRPVLPNGTTASNLYVDGDYSITVRDRNGGLVASTTIISLDGTVFAPLDAPTFTGVLRAPVIRVTGGGALSLISGDHALQIGQSDGRNLRMDQNEIQTANDGVAVALLLNNDGGNVTISAAGDVTRILSALEVAETVKFEGLPTSNPGGTGNVWNDGGTLKIT